MLEMTAEKVELSGRQIATKLIPIENIAGDDQEDTRLLRQMALDARDYLASFSWCREIYESYFGGGVGGIFAVFLFHIHPANPEVDPWIWIVVGDIPSAYLPLSDAGSPHEVFEKYIDGMRRWIKAACNGDQKAATSPDVPPMNLPATPEWAERLKGRLDGISEISPFFPSWT